MHLSLPILTSVTGKKSSEAQHRWHGTKGSILEFSTWQSAGATSRMTGENKKPSSFSQRERKTCSWQTLTANGQSWPVFIPLNILWYPGVLTVSRSQENTKSFLLKIKQIAISYEMPSHQLAAVLLYREVLWLQNMNLKAKRHPKWQLKALPNHNKPWSSFPMSAPHLVARANPSAHSWFPSENTEQPWHSAEQMLPGCSLQVPHSTRAAHGPLTVLTWAQQSPDVLQLLASARPLWLTLIILPGTEQGSIHLLQVI